MLFLTHVLCQHNETHAFGQCSDMSKMCIYKLVLIHHHKIKGLVFSLDAFLKGQLPFTSVSDVKQVQEEEGEESDRFESY